MDALQMLKTRRCVREFTDQAVPREIIEDIIDCGRLAATAINIQPWEFVAVTDPQTRCRIAEATDYGKFIATAPVCIVVLTRNTQYYLEDGSAATENILLAARAHGLGACWVSGDKREYAPAILKLIAAPEDRKLISLIPIGYPAEHPVKEKRPLSEVLHWERY